MQKYSNYWDWAEAVEAQEDLRFVSSQSHLFTDAESVKDRPGHARGRFWFGSGTGILLQQDEPTSQFLKLVSKYYMFRD